MKTFSMTFAVFFLLLAAMTDAQAVVCARGYRGAGCVGPNGALVAPRRPVVVAPPPVVVAPRPVVVAPVYRGGCRWINGVRVCR
jgi:hypothetical protein